MMVKYFPVVIALGAVFLVMELRMHASFKEMVLCGFKAERKIIAKGITGMP